MKILLLPIILTAFALSAYSQGGGQNMPNLPGGQNRPNMGGGQNAANLTSATGQFSSVTVEHNITRNGRLGMVIHARFSIRNAIGRANRVVASFMYSDGRTLMGNEKAFQSSTGGVMAWVDFTPAYQNAVYNDSQIFMPYSALNMAPGKAALKLKLTLYDVLSKKHFLTSNFVNFTYTK